MMTGAELRKIRFEIGLGVVEFGRALGFAGNPNSISVHVRRMENGRKPITITTARRALKLTHPQGCQCEACEEWP